MYGAIRVCTLSSVVVSSYTCGLIFFQHCFLYLQGWYIVTYALGIYQLNLFIAFLTPKIDPALDELGESDLGVFFIFLLLNTNSKGGSLLIFQSPSS